MAAFSETAYGTSQRCIMDPHGNKAYWSKYWEGRGGRDRADSPAGVGAESAEDLVIYWRRIFEDQTNGDVLDLACGAGAVLRHAAAAGCRNLIGLDISVDAVQLARKSVPFMLGVTASADAIPLADRSVSLVVSQFGFEYADRMRAAAEIRRILRPGGSLHAIVHMKQGAIDDECRGHLARAEAIQRSGYLKALRDFYSAVFAHDQAPSQALLEKMDAAFADFSKAQSVLIPEIQAGGIAAQLHNGARERYQRRRAYNPADTMAWIDGWAAQIEAYAGRMTGMLNAAIDAGEAKSVLSLIAPDGRYELEAFQIGGRAAAWRLTAQA